MLKRNLIAIVIIALALFVTDAFGQNQRKKKNYNLPEADDEVLVTFRKKQEKPKISNQRKSTNKRKVKPFFDEADALFGKRRRKSSHKKYANQEVSYRTKRSKSKIKKGVTHDPEFENWANRKRKIKKQEK